MGTQTCPVSNVKANGIKVTLVWDKFRVPKGSIKNLSIKGMAESTKPAGGGIAGAGDLVKVATLNHTREGILNTYEFKMGIPNMRIAAGAKSSVNMSFPDTFSDYKAKDLFIASPQAENYDGSFGIYSKIYAPHRGKAQELHGGVRIAPFRIKNL